MKVGAVDVGTPSRIHTIPSTLILRFYIPCKEQQLLAIRESKVVEEMPFRGGSKVRPQHL